VKEDLKGEGTRRGGSGKMRAWRQEGRKGKRSNGEEGVKRRGDGRKCGDSREGG